MKKIKRLICVSPIVSLILGCICNKVKAVSSFEFKYSFVTMLTLIVGSLVFHSYCFISLARLSLVLLKLQGGVIHWQRDTRIAFVLSCQKKSNEQMQRLYTYAASVNEYTPLLLLQYDFEYPKWLFKFSCATRMSRR